MPLLHDPTFRSRIHARILALRPDARPRWGKMELDQMFWHVSSGLEVALGTLSCEPGQDSIFTRTVLKRIVLYGPWPKGRIDTLKEITATDRYDTEAERQRLLELVEAFATRELEGPWPGHPLFGRMRGREQSHLHGRHLDYHLQQFGS